MNVVLILTDTQPTWFVGCYGNGDVCGTPALDAMATRGVRFDRAYTTCPLCTPARTYFSESSGNAPPGTHSLKEFPHEWCIDDPACLRTDTDKRRGR